MVEQFILTVDGVPYSVEVAGNRVTVNGYPLTVSVGEEGIEVNGVMHAVELVGDQALVDGIAYTFAVEWPTGDDGASAQADPAVGEFFAATGVVKAIMPGKIVRILVNEGDQVSEGQVVAVLEAMKMENELNAPCAGLVKRVFVPVNASVEHGQPIVEIE